MTVRYVGLLMLSLLGACGGGGGGDNNAMLPPTAAQPPATPPVSTRLPGPRPEVGPAAFAAYESGQVRPLALSPDGSTLYAVNTPDNRLEILDTTGALTAIDSVVVGMEPVAVALAPDGKAWVVNHLSDSVSIVDVSARPPRVVQTLWVGDEPRDIVFAGSARERAFITTAHRGQNSPVEPRFNDAGTGRADIWVFDSRDPGNGAGGRHEAILTLFGDRPRPLAVSADGLRVYAGVFLSGNRTTVIAPSGIPKGAPTTSADGVAAPDSGLILRFDGNNWIDHRGQVFDASVPFSLPDYDVFEIDAVGLAERRRISGVGTVLFNIAVNPVNNVVYVSNMASRNHVRFAGVASRASTTVRGRVTDAQITLVGETAAQPRLLNKHLDFNQPQAGDTARSLSVSTPLGMAVSGDGATLYLCAFGSQKVSIYDTAALADDTFFPRAADQIALSAGGPSGIVLDETNNRAFVLTRFDNGISIIDLDSRRESAHLRLFNPEPESIVAGRRFLYDATATSGNGNDSCASCHVFGDNDGLAWDLGEPDADVVDIVNTFIPSSPAAAPTRFHPLKGPMTTQSMRGLRGHGPMHWRGDRSGANRVGEETLEEAAFKEFNDAFDAFAALGTELSAADMQAFTDFAMQLRYPPNPVRALDNSLRGIEVRGAEMFRDGVVRIQTGVREVCVNCHPLRPADGLFGTRGLMADNSQSGERNFKIPHFRDQYQKVGMFGWAFDGPPERGPQVRGFAFNHNGATSSNFIVADLGMPTEDLLALRAFLYAFPTESPAITGQQVTLANANVSTAASRIDLLIERGLVRTPVPECDLVVHGLIGGARRAWLMDADALFVPDRSADAALTRDELLALLVSDDDRLTLMCVPWGSGERVALDRNLDGVRNGDAPL